MGKTKQYIQDRNRLRLRQRLGKTASSSYPSDGGGGGDGGEKQKNSIGSKDLDTLVQFIEDPDQLDTASSSGNPEKAAKRARQRQRKVREHFFCNFHSFFDILTQMEEAAKPTATVPPQNQFSQHQYPPDPYQSGPYPPMMYHPPAGPYQYPQQHQQFMAYQGQPAFSMPSPFMQHQPQAPQVMVQSPQSCLHFQFPQPHYPAYMGSSFTRPSNSSTASTSSLAPNTCEFLRSVVDTQEFD